MKFIVIWDRSNLNLSWKAVGNGTEKLFPLNSSSASNPPFPCGTDFFSPHSLLLVASLSCFLEPLNFFLPLDTSGEDLSLSEPLCCGESDFFLLCVGFLLVARDREGLFPSCSLLTCSLTLSRSFLTLAKYSSEASLSGFRRTPRSTAWDGLRILVDHRCLWLRFSG